MEIKKKDVFLLLRPDTNYSGNLVITDVTAHGHLKFEYLDTELNHDTVIGTARRLTEAVEQGILRKISQQ